jgi:hypothetical protein
MRRGAWLLFAISLAWDQISTCASAATGGTTSEPNVMQCVVPKDLIIADGYLTGGFIAQLNEEALQGYVIGFINGIRIAVVMGMPHACVARMQPCIADRDLADLARQVVNHVLAKPGRFDEFADVVAFHALFGTCVTELQ